MTAARVLLDVAVILVAAWAGGRLFQRLGQPAVVGEIAAGVALGPTLLGALPGDPAGALFPPDAQTVLKLIGQIGLALFMFTVGWDLNLRVVRRRESAAAGVSILSMLLPFALGLGLAVYLHPEHDTVRGQTVPFGPFALFIGAALAMTAFPVLARILSEMRLSATPLGGLVLSAAAIDDVAGWTILAAAVAVLEASGAWEYLRMIGECVVFVGFVFVVLRPLLPRLAEPALVVPIALGGAYVTDAIGIHAVFGAFLVGVAMPRRSDDEARRALAPVVAVLAPIYFVMSGMAVDIPGLRAGDVAAFALILIAACAGKFFGAYGGARLARIPRRDAAAIGVLMNTRGLIEIVLLTVGRDKGLIDDRLFTLFALMAITTTLLTSPALRRLTRPDTRAVPMPGGDAGDPTRKVPGFNAPGWSRRRRAGGGLP